MGYMNYTSYIADVRNHIRQNVKDSHTVGLLKSVREAIDRKDASPVQQDELLKILSEIEKLWSATPQIFIGGSNASNRRI